MPCIGLIFELSTAETVPGQEICITGSLHELGSWDPFGVTHVAGSLRQLRTSARSYPCWSLLSPVWIKLASEEPEAEDDIRRSPKRACPPTAAQSDLTGAETFEVEYKYVKDAHAIARHGGPGYEWEDKIPNRHIRVPKVPGTLWFISDAAWNSTEPTHIKQIVQLADLLPHSQYWEHMLCFEQPDFVDLSPSETSSDYFRHYDIEDEFEVLTETEPSASKLAALKDSSDLAAELMELRKENTQLKSERESQQEELQFLKQEITRAKAAGVAAVRARLPPCLSPRSPRSHRSPRTSNHPRFS